MSTPLELAGNMTMTGGAPNEGWQIIPCASSSEAKSPLRELDFMRLHCGIYNLLILSFNLAYNI
jgi:hypothetical protein